MYLCTIEQLKFKTETYRTIKIQNRSLSYNFHSGVQIDKALHVQTRGFGEQQLSTVGRLFQSDAIQSNLLKVTTSIKQ